MGHMVYFSKLAMSVVDDQVLQRVCESLASEEPNGAGRRAFLYAKCQGQLGTALCDS